MNSLEIADLSPDERRVLLARLFQKRAGGSTSSHPLSYNQQGIWFLYQLAPESSVYNVNFAARINADLNVSALRRAFQMLVNRHPMLRTTFPVHFGRPLQRVFDVKEVRFREVDAAAWSAEELQARLLEEAYCRFDLERGPLLQVSLFKCSAREHILVIVVHHIVIDFWSLSILLHELGQCYLAECTGTKLQLPSSTLQYTDYVRWQTEMIASVEGSNLWTYWQKELAGDLPILRLKTDRPRMANPTYRGASHDFMLSAELSQGLRTLATVHGVTLYMVLLAAFHILLSFDSGQEDLLVGSPMVGRSRAAFENIVGLFTNPVVLRADLSGNPTFEDFLANVRNTVLAALDHQDFPTVLLVERLRLPRDASRPPLCQVMFVLDKPHRSVREDSSALEAAATGLRMDLGGLVLESLPLERRAATLDLVLLIIETPETMAASMRYNSDLFDPTTISRLARHYASVLDYILQDPTIRLDALKRLLATVDTREAEAARKQQRLANIRRLTHISREAVVISEMTNRAP